MIRQPHLYKQRARDITHLIQENENVHLSDKSLHDLYSNMHHAILEESDDLRAVADYYKQEYDDLRKKRFPLKWNELRITLAQNMDKPVDAAKVLEWMFMIDEGERTR